MSLFAPPAPLRHDPPWFLIALGSYLKSMTDLAILTGEAIGPLTADLGNNSCQVFFAPDYIHKVQERGAIGKKRKTVKC